MRFRLPGTKSHIRLFEPVETVDSQYRIVDIGVEFDHGGIDSIAVGGSAYSASQWVGNTNEKADRKAEKKAAKKARKAAKKAADLEQALQNSPDEAPAEVEEQELTAV